MFDYSMRGKLNWSKVMLLGVILTLFITISGCNSFNQLGNGQVTPELEKQVLQIIRDNPEVIIESVQAYQEQQKEQRQASQTEILQEFKTNPKAKIGNSPTTGSDTQQIVLLEFSDFQCPFCGKVQGNLKQFIDKNQDRVTLVFKHLPLTQIHPQAIPAARASWAAQQQGKFWEYHDALFEQQEQLGEDLYLEIANNLNLDMEQFNRDRNSDAAIAQLQEDIQLAQKIGVSGTPFFILNGETFSGAVELSEMEKALTKVSQ
ncbi:MAG: DsbA family protein [Microcoleaceae cyanobacterium MO_207.B10]|nr:DsbA family protein [Microcoleaceae cyanobacterium MO_207.B10]